MPVYQLMSNLKTWVKKVKKAIKACVQVFPYTITCHLRLDTSGLSVDPGFHHAYPKANMQRFLYISAENLFYYCSKTVVHIFF